MAEASRDGSRAFVTVGVLASVVAHAGAVWALWTAPEIKATPRLPTRVELSVAPARVEAPSPVPPRAEPEPSVRAPTRAPAPSRPAPAAPPTDVEPATAHSEPAPVDLSGVTLTNDGAGASWSSPAGNGEARSGPIRAGKVAAAAPVEKNSNGAPLVALGDLSRRPAPPALDGLLRSYYPVDARRLALGGVAVVRARIGSNGRVVSASVASETRPGFGAACRKTLLGSRWTPPLDRSGRAVMTDVSYTCRFRVED